MPKVPDDFNDRDPEIFYVKTGARLFRFFSSHLDPIYYDKSQDGRFNATDGSFGVLYAAEEPAGAFAETFLRNSGRRLIDLALVDRKSLVNMESVRDLEFIHFDAEHLAPLGATAEISHSSPPYSESLLWADAMHNHPCRADGIAYGSRHDPSQMCFAIFDRAMGGVQEIDRSEDLRCEEFWKLCVRYRLGIPPS